MRLGCGAFIFTVVASIAICAFSAMALFKTEPDAAGPVGALAGLVLGIVGFCLYAARLDKKDAESDRRFHEGWQARHKDDLCSYCDAWRDSEGAVHHAPSCRNR